MEIALQSGVNDACTKVIVADILEYWGANIIMERDLSRDAGTRSEGFRGVVVSLLVSFAFFVVYFMIHWTINAYTGKPPHAWTFDPHEMIGPYTISLCSSLLIFSFGCFVSRGINDLSLVVPDVFFNAFLIFVIAQIAVQIAGHAQILSISNHDDFPPVFIHVIDGLAFLSVPLTFLLLLWLEAYQSYIYDFVHDRLPEAALSGHPNPIVTIVCTLVSIFVAFIKKAMGGYEWVFLIETTLAVCVILNTLLARRRPHVRSGDAA